MKLQQYIKKTEEDFNRHFYDGNNGEVWSKVDFFNWHKSSQESLIQIVVENIEKFKDRDDGEILKDIGESAGFPAPCSRKTCLILIDLIKDK